MPHRAGTACWTQWARVAAGDDTEHSDDDPLCTGSLDTMASGITWTTRPSGSLAVS